MSYENDNWPDAGCMPAPSWQDRKIKSGNPDLTKHYPNRNESKLLRKLMSQTGLSEKELREHKKYRGMLSRSQKAQGSKDRTQRLGLRILKNVLQKLKLPKEHPLVLEELNKELERIDYIGWRRIELKQIGAHTILQWANKK